MTKKLLILLLLLPTLCLGGVKYTPTGQVVKVIPHGLGSNRAGILVDESGTNHNATIKAPLLLTIGTADVQVGTPWNNLFGFQYFRMVSWFYVASGGSGTRLIYYQDFSGGTDNIKIFILNDDTVQVVYKGVDGDAERTHTTAWTVEEVKWHSIMVQIDTTTLNIWFDGVHETDGEEPGAISAWANNVPLEMTFGAAGGDLGLLGRRRWLGLAGTDTALTDADAVAFYNSPQTWLAGASMSGYWPCNEGTNATFLDRSGNDRSLTGSGTVWLIDQVPETGVNADTRMGIGTTSSGYIDLVTTAKVSQGTARTADNASNDTTIEFVGDLTADYVVNNVVESPSDNTWHRITVSNFGDPNTQVTITPSPATAATWDGQSIQAFKGQLQILTEDAFAICMWVIPASGASDNRFISAETGAAKGLMLRALDTPTRIQVFWEHSAGSVSNLHSDPTFGLRHSFVGVGDNASGSGVGNFHSWIDKIDPLSDTYDVLDGGNPDMIRLGARADTATSGAADSFGPFCLIDLSDITGGVDTEVREGIRDAWDDADMDWEVFFADLLSKFDAWTGPSDTDTITVTYWKLLNVVPYGLEIDTDNLIERHTRVLTRGSALPAEGAADATDSDTENCTGIPLDTLGDSFKGSRLWMDASYNLDFGDHADFSFDGGSDSAFSYMIWSDASPGTWVQPLVYKAAEYLFSVAADGKLRIVLIDAESDTINTTTDAVRADGTLHCWVFTYDGGGVNSGLSIYEDGVVVASTDGGGGAYGDMPNSANSLLVDGILASHVYNAQLYNRELSANEVLSLYRNSAYR